MESCWTFQPHDRPGIADILQRLRAASNSSKSPSPGYDDEMDVDSDNQGPLDEEILIISQTQVRSAFVNIDIKDPWTYDRAV